jgi:hypothetical protein
MKGVDHGLAMGAALALIGLAGCHDTAIVKVADRSWVASEKKPADKLPGIPFFAMKGVCQRESIWLEPQYTITLDVIVDDAPPVTRSFTLSRQGYESAKAKEVLALLRSLQTPPKEKLPLTPERCPAHVSEQFNAIDHIPDSKPHCVEGATFGPNTPPCKENLSFVANTAHAESVVDYDHIYFLNTRSPWNGSAQVAAKLAPNGTLTEGSAQRDDETLNSILSAISTVGASLVGGGTAAAAAAGGIAPVAATLQSRAKTKTPAKESHETPKTLPPVCRAESPFAAVKNEVKYSFTVTTTVFKHDHKEDDKFDGGESCQVKPEGVATGNFTVTKIDADSGKKSDKAIEFSGQVTLPDKSDDKKEK